MRLSQTKLCIFGVLAIVIPCLLMWGDTALLNCGGAFSHFAHPLTLLDHVLSRVPLVALISIPLGTGALLVAYGVWARRKGHSKFALSVELALLTFLVLLLGVTVILFLSPSIVRDNSPNAIVKSLLHNQRTLADSYADTHGGGYVGYCDSSEIASIRKRVMSLTPERGVLCGAFLPEIVCTSSHEGYVLRARLPLQSGASLSYYCADSTGYVGPVTTFENEQHCQ